METDEGKDLTPLRLGNDRGSGWDGWTFVSQPLLPH